MDDFTIRAVVDLDVVQILETMQSSRRLPIPQISPGDDVKSGIVSIDPSKTALSDKFLYPDDYFGAPEDQVRCFPGLDHAAVETFGPYLTEILLNVQIISRILEDQQVLPVHCLGDFFPQITISRLSAPVATLLHRGI
jgi:hypothetical protein